jgi:hypothetical protein
MLFVDEFMLLPGDFMLLVDEDDPEVFFPL